MSGLVGQARASGPRRLNTEVLRSAQEDGTKGTTADGLKGVAGGERGVRSVVVGTAGHIDHGKTALVLALTGTNTDRLPEEKARGITIDLGFAALELAGPGGVRLDVSLVDVPGHHAFVRNMLAGAGGIDAVLLVVAADEGVKAQTVEHLQICRLLGIGRGMVVLTKRDAVGAERLEGARGEVARLVEGTFLEGAPVVAVSALRGDRIGELKAVLARVLGEVPARSGERVTRLPVDRVFSVRGFGTVVTGTLQAGKVRAGESLRLEPGGRGVRVRGVQVHGKARAEAAAPNRVALNLAGVEVSEVQRGETVVPEGTLAAVSVVDAEVALLPGALALRHRGRVRVHAFAAESLATVLLFEAADGGRPLVRLRLAKPMVLAPGDRFVLRQPSPAMTLGGGFVLDAHPLPRLRKGVALEWLRELRWAAGPEQVVLRVRRRGVAGISVRGLIAETGFTREAVRRMLAPAVVAGVLVAGTADGEPLISAAALEGMEGAIEREVGRAAGGISRAELRSRLKAVEWVFALALERLRAARRVEFQGELLWAAGRGAAATDGVALTGRAAEVDQMYRAAGLAAPIASEAAERLGMGLPELRGVITALLRAGRLVRMGSDALLVHVEALDGLKTELKRYRGESFDVARFKAVTGLSRKHAIPLLEYLDGARVTRNVSGVRVIN